MLFRVLWWFDALVAAVVIYFFFAGLAHETISSSNAGIWTIMLVGVAAVLLGSRALRAAGRPRAAIGLLLVLAIPGLVATLFLVLILTTNPRWN
jgi:hypothetical protein